MLRLAEGKVWIVWAAAEKFSTVRWCEKGRRGNEILESSSPRGCLCRGETTGRGVWESG